jgi:UDP-glucuronate decarboxylase
MKRVLVTGGAGFIGSHLCERLLEDGHHVRCMDNLYSGSRRNIRHLLDHPRFEFDRHDVNHPFIAEVDEIFHLACPASPVHYQRNPVRTVRTCVQGTLHALEAAQESGARLFIASTSEVYGDPLEHPQTEAYWGNVNPVGVRACYDEGKRCAEALAVSFARQYGTEIRIGRIFNTYGPRMDEDDGRVVSNFVVQALRHEPITIYGDGTQTRSFCYVDDLVDAVLRFMRVDGDATILNLGNPSSTELKAFEPKSGLRSKSWAGHWLYRWNQVEVSGRRNPPGSYPRDGSPRGVRPSEAVMKQAYKKSGVGES